MDKKSGRNEKNKNKKRFLFVVFAVEGIFVPKSLRCRGRHRRRRERRLAKLVRVCVCVCVCVQRYLGATWKGEKKEEKRENKRANENERILSGSNTKLDSKKKGVFRKIQRFPGGQRVRPSSLKGDFYLTRVRVESLRRFLD